jgi:ABC-type proline/glycine betaine transport systems, ATPase components
MCADPCSQLHAYGGLFLIMSNMISLNKLSKAFSGKVILQDLDLEIEKRSFPGGDWWFGHWQIRFAQMHHEFDPAR